MQFLAIYLSLVLWLARKTVSSEKNEFCEALVIRECSGHSRGLLKVLESEDKHLLNEECDALQVGDRPPYLYESGFHIHFMRCSMNWNSAYYKNPLKCSKSSLERRYPPPLDRFIITVETRFNDPLCNEVLGVTKYDILRPSKRIIY